MVFFSHSLRHKPMGSRMGPFWLMGTGVRGTNPGFGESAKAGERRDLPILPHFYLHAPVSISIASRTASIVMRPLARKESAMGRSGGNGGGNSGSGSKGGGGGQSQTDLDNHSNQLNPNNDAYWQSRGESGRPGDWDDDD